MNNRILSFFKTDQTLLSASELVKLSGLKKADVIKCLEELKKEGLVKFAGGGKWKRA